MQSQQIILRFNKPSMNPFSILHLTSQVFSKIFIGQEYNNVGIYPAGYKKLISS